jgi:hypothetical protein
MECKPTQRKRCGRDKDECGMCWERSFASHYRSQYWDTTKNNGFKPQEIAKHTKTKYWFNCEICHHSLNIDPHTIGDRDSWCSFCASKKLCDDLACEACHLKSFASCKRSVSWSYLLNETSPRFVFKNSPKKFFMNCDKCKHSFRAGLSDITTSNSWCPFCAHQRLCESPDCILCLEASFSTDPLAANWDYEKNKISPRLVFKKANVRYWFNCGKCPRSFFISPAEISREMWCPCCNSFQFCNLSDCKSCFEKSFAVTPRAKYWSYIKNSDHPRFISKNSDEKRYFDCVECGNEYYAVLSGISRGNWCKCVKNKTEALFRGWLIEKYEDVVYQPTFSWCKNSSTDRHLPFDFQIKNCIIEIDGGQHFEDVKYWKSTSFGQRQRDIYKSFQALRNGFSIIRVPQEMVLKNKFDWKADVQEMVSKAAPGQVYYLPILYNTEKVQIIPAMYEKHHIDLFNVVTTFLNAGIEPILITADTVEELPTDLIEETPMFPSVIFSDAPLTEDISADFEKFCFIQDPIAGCGVLSPK